MSETHTPENPAASEEEQVQESPDGNNDLVPRSLLNEVIQGRDRAKRDNRELKSRLEEIESQLSAQKQERAKNEGADEQARLYLEELEKERQKRSELESTLQRTALENQVKSRLTQYTEYLDDSWRLLGEQFTIERDDDSGDYVPVVAANPYKSIDEHLKEFFDSRPYLAKNPRKPGAGVPKQEKQITTGAGSYTFEELKRLPREERVKKLQSDRKLAEEYNLQIMQEMNSKA